MMELNRIYNVDNVIGMKNLPDNFVDLTVTSPPYDNLRTYNGQKQFDFESVAEQLYRVTKDGGTVVWIVADAVVNGSETGTSFKQALHFKDIGFKLHDTMIWTKQGFLHPCPVRYPNTFDYMFVLVKGKIKTVNLIKDRENKYKRTYSGQTRQRMKNGEMEYRKIHKVIGEYGVRTNVWQQPAGYMSSTPDKIAYNHPAIFPEKLCKDHIISWSNEGDLVLDPFSGSGTTAVCCRELNRNFIAFELDEKYYADSVKRLESRDLNIRLKY